MWLNLAACPRVVARRKPFSAFVMLERCDLSGLFIIQGENVIDIPCELDVLDTVVICAASSFRLPKCAPAADTRKETGFIVSAFTWLRVAFGWMGQLGIGWQPIIIR
jgi:hypothetical protein